ncbi:MAG: hypothetical protein NVS3B12_27360 [Acidimicrobiales bacterium]
MLIVAGLAAALVIVIAVVAARDMDRRGRNGELYAIVILFVLPVGLVLWALDRRRPVLAAAEVEGAPVEDGPDENGPVEDRLYENGPYEKGLVEGGPVEGAPLPDAGHASGSASPAS